MADKMRVTSEASAMRPRITAPGLPCQHPGKLTGPTIPMRRPGGLECFGHLDLRAQADLPSALRTDIHEEASVKTGARRVRDCPDIHPASAANAARHER